VQIDKRRLAELSDEVDQLHHESMRTLRDSATRRSFLTKAATGGGLLAVGSMVAPISGFMPAAAAQEGEGEAPVSDDVELAMFMAGLELAAVEVYRAAAATGKLTNAGNQIATMFGGHHQAHADALNEIIGEDAAITKPNATVVDEFAPMIRAAADEVAILEIAYSLEEAAASTYLVAVGELEDARHAGTLATILPVESQHATVIATALGKPASEYLIDFLTPDAAVDPADYPAE